MFLEEINKVRLRQHSTIARFTGESLYTEWKPLFIEQCLNYFWRALMQQQQQQQQRATRSKYAGSAAREHRGSRERSWPAGLWPRPLVSPSLFLGVRPVDSPPLPAAAAAPLQRAKGGGGRRSSVTANGIGTCTTPRRVSIRHLSLPPPPQSTVTYCVITPSSF